MTTQAPSFFNRYATLTQSPITESVAAQRDRARADQMAAMQMVAELRKALKRCVGCIDEEVAAADDDSHPTIAEHIRAADEARALLKRTIP